MNVEELAEMGLQSPLIIRDENGNKCVCNNAALPSVNGSPASPYQEAEHEDYIELKDTNDLINRSSHPCTEAENLQKVTSDYICMGTMDLEAMHIPASKQQYYMHALKQNFTEPTSLLQDSLAMKSIQNLGTEESVPYCQADLTHFAAVELSKSTAVQDELDCSQIGQEGTISSESFITVINLGSKCNEEGSVSPGEMNVRDNLTKSVSSCNIDVPANPSTMNMNLDRGMPHANALPVTEDNVTNYIDLVSQNREWHENQGKQDAEWVNPCFRGSPELEPFKLYGSDPKKYMHSTPEPDEDNEWTVKHGKDGAINALCPLAIQSFDKLLEKEFCKDGEILTKGPNLLENDQIFLERCTPESETIQNVIPKLERAALPEPKCEATFVVFSPIACENGSISSFTGPSKNTACTVFAMEDEVGGISKAGKNSHAVKDCVRRASFRSNSERVMAKPVTRSPLAATITKARKAEIVSFPKPNFKNVKPKVVSRPIPQSKESTALKAAQRSPQLSTPSSSSPSSSPRQTSSSIAVLRKKMDLDRGTKAETPMNKTYKQHFNKHLPSQAVHAATHSENTSHKVTKTAVLKQNVEPVDKARCPNSTFLSVSGAVACASNTGGTLNDKMEIVESCVQPCALNICPVPQEEQQNECLGVPTENSAPDAVNEGGGFARLPLASSPKGERTQLQSLSKDTPVTLRNTLDSRRTYCSKRRSDSKNTHATKVSSPQRTVQPFNSGTEVFSSKGRLTSASALPGSLTSPGKLIPKSKVPIKGPGFRRTPSISSVSSTQSDQSTCSNKSTSATVIKNGEWPSKSACQNGSAIKPVPRPRVYSLKNTPKGTKRKFGVVSPCVPKSTGALLPGRKTSDSKGSQQSGPSGQNGPRSLFSAFTSVDKGKQRSPKNSCIQTRSSNEVHSTDTKTHELTQYKRKCEHQSGIIQQLKKCLASTNRKFEALTLVIQHLQSERDHTLKQHKELSLELIHLRGDLGTATAACEKLEKDRNELQAAYEGFVQKLNQQHQSDLAELEEKLKQFYTAECEKLQSICIEEAEKYKAQLQEQVDNLTITHENFKIELEASHTEKIEELKREYESSFSELKNAQESERKTLEESFQEKQEELEKKIAELQSENDSLNEKLKSEEQKRIAKEKANLKNPQIMYLEQELESLKAVLDIKNEKLHQQDIKLFEMEKMVENNTALEEKWSKLQQENEELKARMNKHVELSRQLSTEQAVLQESLEKESKVNKRLSMENEELLWKLHNGDLCSRRKLSPTTPPMPLQSPRNSGSFSSPPVSPR